MASASSLSLAEFYPNPCPRASNCPEQHFTHKSARIQIDGYHRDTPYFKVTKIDEDSVTIQCIFTTEFIRQCAIQGTGNEKKFDLFAREFSLQDKALAEQLTDSKGQLNEALASRVSRQIQPLIQEWKNKGGVSSWWDVT
ncbi:MAG TPA: hypothetical protein VLE89_07285 [Chlamydiales bacterium]|nr:hypothetical protein [Chlamydiales bacterium]